MAINYPSSLDTLTNPSSSDKQNSPSHADQHADVNDIVEALEAKVGVDDSTVVTTLDYYVEQAKLGWINPNQTWEYASATTITVPSGAASIYSVGDKIKITQTTVKYFYVTAVADTTLTVTGGSDYTVANAAITENYYSKAASPVGFPKNSNTFSPIGVAYAEITSDFTVAGSASLTDVTNLAVTVTVPTGGRIRITAFAPKLNSNQASGTVTMFIRESSTTLSKVWYDSHSADIGIPLTCSYVKAPTAGSHTYKVSLQGSTANTHVLSCGATFPAFILVELI